MLSGKSSTAARPAAGLRQVFPHGLRAGFITEAYRAGVADEAIMGHTRHRDLKTMRGYVRRASALSREPGWEGRGSDSAAA